MKARMRHNKCWRRSAGLTLVEALAGTLILGTLLVSIILGQSRLVSQSVRAKEKLQAVRIADALLAQWWQDVTSFPRDGTGEVDSQPDWTWQTRRIDNQQAQVLHADAVELCVTSPTKTVAVKVELFVPLPPEEKTEDQPSEPSPSNDAH